MPYEQRSSLESNDRPIIPILIPDMPTTAEIVPYLEQIDQRREYSNFGPLSRVLESRVAAKLNVSPTKVVSAANATLALIGALAVSKMKDWLVPNWSFPATAKAVMLAGGKLNLQDITSDSWLPQLDESDRTNSGLVVTVPFGSRVPLDVFSQSSPIVFDAAASLGNFDDLSSLGDLSTVIYSLHATKILGAGEGGLAVFGSESQAALFRKWSNFGLQNSRLVALNGTNAKLSEYSAAVALASLDRWQAREQVHVALRKWSLQTTESFATLGFPAWQRDSISPYWIVTTDSAIACRALEKSMRERNISVRQWWPQLVSEYALPGGGETRLKSTPNLSCSPEPESRASLSHVFIGRESCPN